MAIIHEATMAPAKLELLTSWLPGRSWYPGGGVVPLLTKAGGFRLGDPEGKVGLEFMAVTDDSGDEPVTYHVPPSYRGAPLTGADAALIGTAGSGDDPGEPRAPAEPPGPHGGDAAACHRRVVSGGRLPVTRPLHRAAGAVTAAFRTPEPTARAAARARPIRSCA